MKRSFLARDILRFEAIADPQWTPDGKNIYFVKQEPLAQENKKQTAIFRLDENDTPLRVTDWQLNARNPRFSPDGKYLAFIGKVEKKSTIYLLDLLSAELKCLVTDQNISSPPVWSNGSDQLAFVSKKYQKDTDWVPYEGAPASDAHKEMLQEGVIEAAEGEYQSDIKVINTIKYRFNEIGYLGYKTHQLFIAKLPEESAVEWNNVVQVSHIDIDYGYPVFSAADDKLYAVAYQGKDYAGLQKQNVVRICLKSFAQETIVAGQGNISNLLLAPDGTALAFWACDLRDPNLWFENIYIYPCDADQTYQLGELENTTINFYRQLGKMPSSGERMGSSTPKYEWLPDNSGFLLLFCDGGASALTEVHRGEHTRGLVIWQDKMRSLSAFAKNDDQYLLLVGSMTRTDDLVLLTNNEEKLLYETNSWINEEINLAVGERYNYFGAEGLPMEGWSLTPGDWDRQTPLPGVLFVHGGPHGVYGSAFMFQTQLLATNGYAVTYVNPRGSSSYGFEFANKVYLDWGGGDYEDIMAGLDYMIRSGYMDRQRVGITGWSYGGYISSWAITQTNRFKAAVIGAPVTNRHSMYGTSDIGFTFAEKHSGGNPWDNPIKLLDRSAINYAYRIETPVLLIHGEKDYRCPISQSEELFTAIKRQGKTAVMVRYPDEPHNFKQLRHLEDRYLRTISWFNHYLK